MSLLAVRPTQERASVALPTITCSSCGDPIPLSSMGEHICRPAATASTSASASASRSGHRPAQRPTQITIPPITSSSGPRRGPSPIDTNPPRPPFAGPSSARSSPSTLSPANLSPANFPMYNSPNPRTPSPTNPFFPAAAGEQKSGTMVHGLGLGLGRPEGPYPTDRPIPEKIRAALPDTTSGGGAGMAGVGRRAFAAAAWGVTAGVAMASAAQSRPSADDQRPRQMPPPQQQGWPVQPQSARPPPSRPMASPQPQPMTAPLPSQQPRLDVSSAESSTRPPMPMRQRSGTVSQNQPPPSSFSQTRVPTLSSSPPQKERSRTVDAPRRKASVSSMASSSRSSTSNKGESIAALLKARAGQEKKGSGSSNGGAFFEKYRQLANATPVDASDSKPSALGVLRRPSVSSQGTEPMVMSPEQTNLHLDDDNYDDDKEESALPWATPAMSARSNSDDAAPAAGSRPGMHDRYPTAGSESSSSSIASSSRSGKWGGVAGSGTASGPESEEVVTPSQSWEGGLSERVSVQKGRHHQGFGYESNSDTRDMLEQIGEEDEDEIVVFGAKTPSRHHRRRSSSRETPRRINHSASNSTITSNIKSTAPLKDHSRARTLPEVMSRAPSSSGTSATGSRRSRQCQKCGDEVGGQRRYVERDGVVLCEKDWKKLYLPSCRRCNLPIEKSAVSSSDGQLKGKWHKACFTCTKCDSPFEGDSFYVLGGKPWCQQHYHEENGTLCANPTCRKPIEGACVLTSGPKVERYHPGHLRCDHRGGVSGAQNCRESMDEYYEVAGGRYCERHVGEALRGAPGGGMGRRAEKRRTRLVDLPSGAF